MIDQRGGRDGEKWMDLRGILEVKWTGFCNILNVESQREKY